MTETFLALEFATYSFWK